MKVEDIPVLATIYRETLAKVDAYSQRVSEGRDINAASEFCRWLQFSGICKLLEAYPNQVQSNHPLKVDGRFLRWKADEVAKACSERYRTGNLSPSFDKAEFESLHQKVDRMAAYLSRLTDAGAIRAERVPDHVPELKIVQGGNDL